MASADQPARTAVGRQIRIALRIVILVAGVVLLLYLCVRGPLRRWRLYHPRFVPGAQVRLERPVGPLAAGNLNGDVCADLVVGTGENQVPRFEILLGGAAGFDTANRLEMEEPFSALDLVLGDLNGDGLDDLLATPRSEQATAMIVYWNLGGFRFDRAAVATPLRLVDVIDEDRDGHPDLVGLTRNYADIRAHRASDRQVDAKPVVEEGIHDTSVRDFAAAHLDGGGMDVALVAGSRVRVLRRGGLIPDPTSYFNLPPVTFAGQRMSPAPPSLVFRDLNGDGRPDLAYLDAEAVTLLLGFGGGEFEPARYPVLGQPAVRLVAGDFNGDGRVDLLTVGQDLVTLEPLLAE